MTISVILQPIAERTQRGSMADSLQRMTATHLLTMHAVVELPRTVLHLPMIAMATLLSRATDLNSFTIILEYSRLSRIARPISTEKMHRQIELNRRKSKGAFL